MGKRVLLCFLDNGFRNTELSQTKSTQLILPRIHHDRIHVDFDDHRLMAIAGLILSATLALYLGLPQLVDQHLGLGHAPGRANTGDKMMSLVASALAGGDCIDDALRPGGTAVHLRVARRRVLRRVVDRR